MIMYSMHYIFFLVQDEDDVIIPVAPQRQVVRPPAPRSRGRGGRRGRPRLDPDTDLGNSNSHGVFPSLLYILSCFQSKIKYETAQFNIHQLV